MAKQWSPKEYDVFISFRGDNTRRNFVSHLYSALCRDSIKAYIDNETLEKGDKVWPSLSRAIHDSQIAIVVFSKDYADSEWCLKELVKILWCRKSQGLVVIPVFYEVDPSHIRNCSGSYGEAFKKYEQYQHNGSIEEWKAALTEAANISGWDSRSRDYKNESQIIQKIVQDVLEKLNLRSPFELSVKGLVEIDQICKDVKLLLSNRSKKQLPKNVQVIGIWGMGGIGKTTIAKALFSELFPQYDSVCFLANVREESKKLGPLSLCDKLLSELLKDEHCHTSNLVGSTFITRRLSNKKVLIVLDDVDSSEQLDVLCSEFNYAGLGSKFIITTRNRHLLSGRVDVIYEVKKWSYDKSLELFSLHAFKERHPPKVYEDLSKWAVDYAGGIPLALRVLGSNLYSRSKEFWDSALRKLTSCPNDQIQNVLQVSYDGLDSLERKIFLDIVFFFKGESKEDVIRILDACGFYPRSGLKVLEDKALITITFPGKIQMHDLIQEMGLNIVHQGIEDPGKRSRLRDTEEVSDVLKNQKGSDVIEGIKLDLSQVEDLHLSADTFNRMTTLRILKLHTPSGKRSGSVHYPRAFNKFSDKLRYLEWSGYHLKSLPANFCAKVLVEILMPHSQIIELWNGVQDVVNLARIDLSECKQLKNLPDLCKASKLISVNLSGCESLLDVHPSILSMNTLETLILDGCKKLKRLIRENDSGHLNISVNGCTNLREFSVPSSSIKSLDFGNKGIEQLGISIGCLRNIVWHNVHDLRLGVLPDGLEELRICNFRLQTDERKLHKLFYDIRCVRILHLKNCCNLFELPVNIRELSDLYELRLDGSSIKTLPASMWSLRNLRILSLENCKMLRSLPKLLSSVKELNAVNCQSLATVSNFEFDMEVKSKFITFQNCTRLDKDSLNRIMQGVDFATLSTVFPHISFNGYRAKTNTDNNFVKVCFPGNGVPEQFTYRSTTSAITVNLPSSNSSFLGLILCVVVSPFWGIKYQGAKIWCQCYLADGTKLGDATFWDHKVVTGLNSDHVYMWYDSSHFHSILKIYDSSERQVSFEFFVTNDMGELNITIGAKECGVRLLFNSDELCRPLRELYSAKWPSQGSAFASDWSYRKSLESDDINNQERNLSENCSCSPHCLIDVLKYLWRLISI